jgi:hypothetical protein
LRDLEVGARKFGALELSMKLVKGKWVLVALATIVLTALAGCGGPGGPTSVQQVSTPTFTPGEGSYSTSQSVTLSSTTGATIYYTLDNSVPDTTSTRYTGPITVSGVGTITTIRAYATMAGWTDSAVAVANFAIVDPTAVFSRVPSSSGVVAPSACIDPLNPYSTTDNFAYDSFVIASGATINQINWRGGYASGIKTATDFWITIYDNVPLTTGDQPAAANPYDDSPPAGYAPLIDFKAGGTAGELAVGQYGGKTLYDYSCQVPAGGFSAAAGQKYWIRIEALQPGPADWQISVGTGPVDCDEENYRYTSKLSQFRFYSEGDIAFTLLQ